MDLRILLPYQIFLDVRNIKRLNVETVNGSFGFLPNRLDCTAALQPGILMYETESSEMVYLAVDEGVLVKAGNQVLVSVRNAMGGTELGSLHSVVDKEYKAIDNQEKKVRSVVAKLETGFIRQFEEFRKMNG
jgi:F-type H+-transporting ATPase subunit epsilon